MYMASCRWWRAGCGGDRLLTRDMSLNRRGVLQRHVCDSWHLQSLSKCESSGVGSGREGFEACGGGSR